jgi:hypothetical protein
MGNLAVICCTSCHDIPVFRSMVFPKQQGFLFLTSWCDIVGTMVYFINYINFCVMLQ